MESTEHPDTAGSRLSPHSPGVARESNLAVAKHVLRLESTAIAAAAVKLDEAFDRVVSRILECNGVVVVTGLGKSGLIGRKVAATLSSTGTPAVFLHAADALHGDVGIIRACDVIIVISYSGETDECCIVAQRALEQKGYIVAFTSNRSPRVAKLANEILDIGVEHEADPNGLAPTASTTVTTALGDALAVALLVRRGFGPNDFARLHPAGALGRMLAGSGLRRSPPLIEATQADFGPKE